MDDETKKFIEKLNNDFNQFADEGAELEAMVELKQARDKILVAHVVALQELLVEKKVFTNEEFGDKLKQFFKKAEDVKEFIGKLDQGA